MVRRKIDRVELRQTESKGYEFQVGPYDYHVRFEEGAWILDQFHSSVAASNEAHIQSMEVESLNDAVHYALEETW